MPKAVDGEVCNILYRWRSQASTGAACAVVLALACILAALSVWANYKRRQAVAEFVGCDLSLVRRSHGAAYWNWIPGLPNTRFTVQSAGLVILSRRGVVTFAALDTRKLGERRSPPRTTKGAVTAAVEFVERHWREPGARVADTQTSQGTDRVFRVRLSCPDGVEFELWLTEDDTKVLATRYASQ